MNENAKGSPREQALPNEPAADLPSAEQAGPGGQAEARSSSNYTAVVYFHGMGSPRRHEEISRLTDGLDLFSHGLDIASVGRLRDQKVLLEPSRTEEDEDVAFVQIVRLVRRFARTPEKRRFRAEGKVRIYEGFWSPHAASDLPWWRVLLWLLSRFTAPISVLLEPWRAHQRLKLGTLYRMQAEHGHDPMFGRLEDFYIKFENWAARRTAPTGRFSGFLGYAASKVSTDERKRQIVELARRWRRRFIKEQLMLLMLILTGGAAAASGILMIGLYVAACVHFLQPEVFASVRQPFESAPYWNAAVMSGAALILLIVFVKAKRYLESFWADVMFWTTQEEKTARFLKRTEILAAAVRILTHVLQDEDCRRLVVVGYSLGSAIAHESLMSLGRRRSARERLGKTLPKELARLGIVSHLVTVGSPIDRIHYFFELHNSRSHRYNRIREALKGSTDDPPFTMDGRRSTVWVNLWDDADAISSNLYSPRALGARDSIIDVWAPSSRRLNPVKAHSGYFNSVAGMRVLFWIAIFGRMPPITDEIPDRPNFFFRVIRPATKWISIAAAWTTLVLLVRAIFFDAGTSLFVLLSGETLALAALNLAGFVADYRYPLLFSRIPPEP